MKRLISAIISIIFLLNTALAYTVTVTVNGVGLSVTGTTGETVGIEPKTSEITGWEVKTGNAEITDNQFVMPEGDVVIEGIIPTQQYTLTLEFPTFTKVEEKTAGVSVTVEAGSTEEGKVFSSWTAVGITLTSVQQTSPNITFIMPKNTVTLVANYTAVTTPSTYTISYNANGGSGAPVAQTKTQGVALTLSSTIPTKSGFTFVGWSTSSAATSVEYNAGDTFTIDANTTLYAVWQEESVTTYTITYDANNGTGAPASQTKYPGIALKLATSVPTRSGYTFLGWAMTNTAIAADYQPGAMFTIDADTTLYAVWCALANEPVLGTGMTPVNWNGSNWVETTVESWDYNYDTAEVDHGTVTGNGTAKWANAKTSDGSEWVWIPRYTYKITSGEHQSAISWNSDLYSTTDTRGQITIKFSNGTTDDTTDGYISHPAFTLGTDELEGIWVSKYEMSMEVNGVDTAPETPEEGNVLTNDEIKMVSKPYRELPWMRQSISNSFINAYNYNRNLDSHLIRNSEWGAVAYLTNAIGRTPYIDNTTSRTGSSGLTQDATYNADDGEILWKSVNGVKSSTTHNVYGIYGMSGSAWEYVSAYYTGGVNDYLSSDIGINNYGGALSSATNSSQLAKYVETYSTLYGSTRKGDAIYETSSSSSGNTSWDNDYSVIPEENKPIFARSGTSNDGSSAGIFYFHNDEGDFAGAAGTRIVLTGLTSTNTNYTISYNANGGTGAPSSNKKPVGIPIALSKTKPTKSGYRFLGWSTNSSATSAEYSAGGSFTVDANTTLYAVWEEESTVNEPVLGTGMTPVNWNGSSWEDTTEENWDYNYEIATAGHGTVAGDGTGKWANARTEDGSMYVWIPRYSYKITSGEHSSGNSWSSVDNPGTNKIEVKFSNGISDNTSDGYIAHPAFTFGTDELEGIWVAKYEASRNDATASSEGTGTTVSSKPGVVSWRNIRVSDMYNYAYNLNRVLDSHLMRNSEWGAVAYLTNAIGKIPYINNSSSFITGNAGGSQDASEAEGVTNAWNTANGVKASTTHNVYGIYDLSGGAWEYVSAYVDNGNSNLTTFASNLVTNKETKYVDVYPMGISDSQADNYAAWSVIKGDAVYETSSSYSGTTSWDGDYSLTPHSSSHVFAHGGDCRDTSKAGVFHFGCVNGVDDSYGGFRAVLTGLPGGVMVNEPVLGTGMTPVNWNGSSWEDTTEENWDYNYEIATAGHGTVAGDGTGKWANARTEDGSMYVWIPRYSYKITSGEHSSGNSWSSVDNPGTNKIEVKFSNGTTDSTIDGYIAHPAFTFGTDELEGIWVAKYEASRNDATIDSVGTGTTVSSKPVVKSWVDTSVSDIYDYAYNLNRALDSHLMKNSEWGAVAYLTNAIGKIPYVNNSSSYITGNAGGSQDASAAEGVTNAWNTANGVKASTTHNVYGIYDLSGGAFEYVSAYVDNGDSNLSSYASNLVANKETKYVEVYPMGTTDSQADNYAAWSNIKGDAVYETSSSYSENISWDKDNSGAPYSLTPVFVRGGGPGSMSNAGVFYFYNHGTGLSNSAIGFRAVLTGLPGGVRVNEPVLGTGMTPVNWNGSDWVDTTVSNWDYNYEIATAGHGTVVGDGTGKWANARTEDGSMYVWIPRYSYKITSGEHSSGNSWSSVDNPGTNKIEVKFSNGTTDSTSDGYIAHPAFTFGTDELTGIWVAKYEASRNDATIDSVGTGTTVSSKPGVKSWVDTSVSDMYDYAYNLNRALDSHLMINSEWGAVAYLTNAIGKIPYINNSSSYITGNAGGSPDASYAEGITNAWNTANGVKASTTHNVYGIYDLSGGAWEYVSAYVDNGNSNLSNYASNLVANKETKYVEVYPIGTTDSQSDNYAAWSNIKGDAVYETSSSGSEASSWDSDYSNAPNSSSPVFTRGGGYNLTSDAGVFYFNSYSGGSLSGLGFRAVLTGLPGGVMVNEPVLGTGMTPVNWNGSTWVDTTEENWDYNYEIATAGHGTVEGDGTGKWANARTADGSMYVWIPRYSYKITSGEHEDVGSWSSVDAPGTGKIEVKFSNGTTDNTSDDYIEHPAFTFGEDELTGIWVAKYEASRNDATIDSVGTGTTVTSKPGVISWRETSVSDMYDYAYNLNRDLDSHLMKNSEWGAVAYLTNAIGKIPYKNNSSSYITGNAGGSQDASGAEGVTNAWNTANGVKASSTHNVYGIYDLSGGAYEYVSAYVDNGDSNLTTYASNLVANKETKYVDVYPMGTTDSQEDNYAAWLNIKGDAVYETSSGPGDTSWDDDYSGAPYSVNPVFLRGGYYLNTWGAGVFCFGYNKGYDYPAGGFRAVLTGLPGGVRVNEPVLGTGMTPVNWNGSDWEDTTVSNWDYNYEIATAGHGTVAGDGTGKWANARTEDGSMYVWIPRYSYKITSGEHSSGNSWSSVDNPGTNKIEVKFSNGTTDSTSDGYIAHPAFTFGTDELEGIWVAKYEASRNDATASSAGSGTTVSSKPGVKSWVNTSVSDMYDYAYNLNRALDSHLMRNSEWGAVAYLTNAIGKIPYINNSSSYITGNAGGSQDAESASGVTNAWNTANGVKASSTHNVYGIYDLSGGAWEYVSAYVDNGNSSLSSYASNLVTNKETKYVDVYPIGSTDSAANNYAALSNIKGDAVYETSSSYSGSTSWDGDISYAPYSSYPVFGRGGGFSRTSDAGVFCFCYDGGSGSSYGFRAVLSIK